MDYGYRIYLRHEGRNIVQVSGLGNAKVREDGLFYAYVPPTKGPGWSVVLMRARDRKAVEIPVDRWYSNLWWIDRETIRLGYGNPAGSDFIERDIAVGGLLEP